MSVCAQNRIYFTQLLVPLLCWHRCGAQPGASSSRPCQARQCILPQHKLWEHLLYAGRTNTRWKTLSQFPEELDRHKTFCSVCSASTRISVACSVIMDTLHRLPVNLKLKTGPLQFTVVSSWFLSWCFSWKLPFFTSCMYVCSCCNLSDKAAKQRRGCQNPEGRQTKAVCSLRSVVANISYLFTFIDQD